MISKSAYEQLKDKYGFVASWAIWKKPGFSPRSNTDDMSVFGDPNLLNILNPEYVFVGLNCSSTHGALGINDVTPWKNFHSGYAHQNDYKLRYALMGTKYWGAYITDIIKHHAEVNSNKVAQYLRKHPEVERENVDIFRDELRLLGGSPVLVALGDKTYDILVRKLSKEYKILRVYHYSFAIGKEDYREQVLSVLDGHR